MADTYDRYETETAGGSGFMMGLLTGTVLGAGLGMLLAPKAGSEIRGQIGEQARNIGNMASEQYRRASETANEWTERGRDIVDKARQTASRAAEEARSYVSATTGSGQTGGATPTGSSFGGSTSGTDFGRS